MVSLPTPQATGERAQAVEPISKPSLYIHKDQFAFLLTVRGDESAQARYANGFPSWIPDSVKAEFLPLYAHPAPQATTTRPLAPSEKSELMAAGVTGECVRVLAFNDRPTLPPAGERAELIAHVKDTAANLEAYQRHRAKGLRAAADMLETDAYQLKNAHATIAGLMIDVEAQQVTVPFIKHPNPAHHTSDFATEHLRDVVEYAKGINAALELWIASAQSGVTTTPCPVVYTKTRAIEAHHGIGAKP